MIPNSIQWLGTWNSDGIADNRYLLGNWPNHKLLSVTLSFFIENCHIQTFNRFINKITLYFLLNFECFFFAFSFKKFASFHYYFCAKKSRKKMSNKIINVREWRMKCKYLFDILLFLCLSTASLGRSSFRFGVWFVLFNRFFCVDLVFHFVGCCGCFVVRIPVWIKTCVSSLDNSCFRCFDSVFVSILLVGLYSWMREFVPVKDNYSSFRKWPIFFCSFRFTYSRHKLAIQ